MSKISIIVPVYNTEKYLSQCLESILNQTFSDIEIICVDDGSKDNSLAILKEYAQKDKRIKVFTQENQGAGASRNLGMEKASGEFLYFMDSDDYLKIDALEKAYTQITKYDADICVFNSENFDESKQNFCITSNLKLGFFKNRNVISPKEINDIIFQYNKIPAFYKLYRKEFLVEKNIKFQNIKCCNDVFFYFASFAVAKNITYVDEKLCVHRVNLSDSITTTRGRHSECCLQALTEARNFLGRENLLNCFEKSFYIACISVFKYEYALSENKNKYQKLYKDFFPKKYVKYYENQISIFQQIFSLKNEGKYKVLRILGFKIKFKRKVKNA